MTKITVTQRIYKFLSSKLFFRIILGFFIISSAYIALVSLYPMAFDENFHMGLIKAYSEHWLPFSITQKPEYDVYGAVVADPSYLYHYLMSFPYRILDFFIGSESLIVILLRMINIAFCVASLLVFRNLLQAAKVSSAVINVTFAFVVLIPVMPLLAGQVNYDNLIMLVLAYAFLLVYRIRESIVESNRIPSTMLFWLIILLAYSSVIKYAFLPMAVALVIYLLGVYFRHVKFHKRVWKQLWGDTKRLRLLQKVILSLAFVIGVGLFVQKYAVNTIQYGHPVPDCGAVMEESRCMAYGPWGRDYRYEQSKPDNQYIKSPIEYTAKDWSYGMWHRLFFTLAGPTVNYQTRKQLPVPSSIAIVLFALAIIAVLWQGRSVLRKYPLFVSVLVVAGLYLVALWYQQYTSYVQTGRPVAINGRYLLPLLPLLGSFSILAISQAFGKLKIRKYASITAIVVMLLFLQGGGAITYAVRSNSSWFWQNDFTQNVTDGAKNILSPIIIGD